MSRVVPFALSLVAILLATSAARAVKVRVRGTSRLAATAFASDDAVELRGKLQDDAGNPIPGGRIEVARVRSRDDATTLPARLSGDCAVESAPAPRPSVRTQAVSDGSFCVRAWPTDSARSTVFRLRYAGDDDYEAADAIFVEADGQRRSVILRISPEPNVLPLERKLHVFRLEARLQPGLRPGELAPQLPLVVTDERGTELDRFTMPGNDSRQFQIESADLAGPGRGELHIALPASARVHAASLSKVVQRTSRVRLSVSGAAPSGDPEEGIDLTVGAATATGAAPGGTVEALLDGTSVGSAPVVDGAAQVSVRFRSEKPGPVPVKLRYLPHSPWWVPDPPIDATVVVVSPPPWRHVPWFLVAAGIAVWVIRTWRRPGRSQRSKPTSAASSVTGRASVEVLERAASDAGWQGRVVDAHEGVAVSGAHLTIRVPSFAGDGIVATARTDHDGAFELPSIEGRTGEGARLIVSARWHTTLERDLPPPGRVAVAIVSRRRALLDDLVRWAKRHGPPWAVGTEPTPGEVARIAHRKREARVGEWAREVERVAFGPAPADEAVEEAVRRLEPGRPEGRDPIR